MVLGEKQQQRESRSHTEELKSNRSEMDRRLVKVLQGTSFLSDLTVSGPRIYTHFKVLLKEG
jgi:hypothetical protein